MTSPKPSLDALPTELQSQILFHLLPTTQTIRFPLIIPRPPARPVPSMSEDYAAWEEHMSFASDPAKWHLQPPTPWPEEWYSNMFSRVVPAEQCHGVYALTCPPHPNARSPNIAREAAKWEASQRKRGDAPEPTDVFGDWGAKKRSEELTNWGDGVILSRSVDGRGCCPGTVGVMLMNRDVCAMARKLLYGTNTFSFPDVDTLSHFARGVSFESRALIKRIALNACGEARFLTGCTHKNWKFEKDVPGPGSELVDVLRMFESVDEVVLAGIGPGVQKKAKWVTTADGEFSFEAPHHRYDVEIAAKWSFECAELIARLVGIVVDKNNNRKDRSQRLFGGTVICKKEEGVEEILRSLRLLGTRIVAPNVEYVLEDDEKLVDVASALEEAREERSQEIAMNQQMGYLGYSFMPCDPFPSG